MTQEQQIIEQFETLRQQYQSILIQKENTKIKINEINTALGAITEKSELYRMVGTILIKKTYDDLKKELEDEKESVELRQKRLEKNEKTSREQLDAAQKKILSIVQARGGAG